MGGGGGGGGAAASLTRPHTNTFTRHNINTLSAQTPPTKTREAQPIRSPPQLSNPDPRTHLRLVLLSLSLFSAPYPSLSMLSSLLDRPASRLSPPAPHLLPSPIHPDMLPTRTRRRFSGAAPLLHQRVRSAMSSDLGLEGFCAGASARWLLWWTSLTLDGPWQDLEGGDEAARRMAETGRVAGRRSGGRRVTAAGEGDSEKGSGRWEKTASPAGGRSPQMWRWQQQQRCG